MESMVMEELRSFYQGKKVFITGHTGFKGAWLCRILYEFGADVCGYALAAQELSLYRILQLEKRIKSITGDIRNLEQLSQAIADDKPEIVIHLAAQPLVMDSYERPVYTYETNVMGTVNVLETLRRCKSIKSFLNVTTDKVYENKEWLWGYRENENLCGYDPYSNSKSCSELVTYSYKSSFFQNSGPAISTARSGNVIGGGDFAANRIIPDCVRSALKGENILVRNPHSVRPYQHVLECLSGYLLIAMKQYQKKEYEGSYNFGPNEESSITTGELTDIFCRAWNEGETGEGITWYTEHQNGPHEANFLKLDCSKAKTVLGWQPKWDIKKSLEETIFWSKAYRDQQEMDRVIGRQIAEYFGEKG